MPGPVFGARFLFPLLPAAILPAPIQPSTFGLPGYDLPKGILTLVPPFPVDKVPSYWYHHGGKRRPSGSSGKV